ncbi:hypothetical protein HPB52_005320 [Rhipicephalus sanguineus]|uniref:Uncharacterized protein n=1 Tax=Rhipicephalus sanguineus TaxID=34632 RepID=A0A9D4PJ95_RHISA|nr:hypothetical protein HPB52_005320 [Rhipicephalus sanguineus]
MDVQRNSERRKTRAAALLLRATEVPGDGCLVDIVQYNNSDSFSVVLINHMGSTVNIASVRSSSSCAEKQVSLAVMADKHVSIFKDSRAAIRAFSVRTVCKEACRIPKGKIIATHTFTWFPAHIGSIVGGSTNLTELAHSKARGLAFRDHEELPRRPAVGENRDQPTPHNDVTQHFYLGQRDFFLTRSYLERRH